LAVDRGDDVARLQAGALRRGAFERGDDHEVAVRPEWTAVAGVARRIDRADLGADALEGARDVVDRALEVLRAQVRGIGIADGLDHPPDRALDERLPVDRLQREALADRVVDRPERTPGLLLGDVAAGRPALVPPDRVAGQ